MEGTQSHTVTLAAAFTIFPDIMREPPNEIGYKVKLSYCLYSCTEISNISVVALWKREASLGLEQARGSKWTLFSDMHELKGYSGHL